MSPSEQAEALYRHARKLRRAVDAVAPLLEAAQQEVEYLGTVRAAAADAACGRCSDACCWRVVAAWSWCRDRAR